MQEKERRKGGEAPRLGQGISLSGALFRALCFFLPPLRLLLVPPFLLIFLLLAAAVTTTASERPRHKDCKKKRNGPAQNEPPQELAARPRCPLAPHHRPFYLIPFSFLVN